MTSWSPPRHFWNIFQNPDEWALFPRGSDKMNTETAKTTKGMPFSSKLIISGAFHRFHTWGLQLGVTGDGRTIELLSKLILWNRGSKFDNFSGAYPAATDSTHPLPLLKARNQLKSIWVWVPIASGNHVWLYCESSLTSIKIITNQKQGWPSSSALRKGSGRGFFPKFWPKF